ncbi:MAG: cupin domain-containing protein [Bacteriovoracaceae bacterium]|mgnify:CR=1 FL=1|jgi:uncharacterized cupin superfamily protein|nr:cupin domain-containing protein [Bacteriovoracaceae bacterium]
MKEDWKNVMNLDQLEYKPWSEGMSYKSESADISSKMGTKNLGFHAEKLSPKFFSCPLHCHFAEEELFIVLDGKAMLRQGDKYKEVKKGDIIHFKTGLEFAHQFYNHTDEDFHFIAISNNEDLDICEYPDSKKILTSIAKPEGGHNYSVYQKNKEADYWKGEEDPRQYWPKEYL